MDEEEVTRLWFEQELKRIRILGLEPGYAGFLRWFCTAIGIAEHCPFKACRRAKACANDRVLCWQIMRDDLNPIILRFRALHWRWRVSNGENPDVAPSTVDLYVRILEEEDAAEAGQDRRPDLAVEDELR